MRLAKTERMIADEVLGQTAKGHTRHLLTYLSYDKGGYNYFTGGTNRRGYSLIVRIEDAHGDGTTSFMVFTGGRKRFLEAARAFSAKRLAEIVPPADIMTAMQMEATLAWEGVEP